MYTLYSDKKNIFECDIQLEGASLSQAFARVILEGKDLNLIFNGEINSDGNCRINLPKLSMLKEGGEMKLEVIADDMYFNPWNSEFDIKKSKNISHNFKASEYDVLVSAGEQISCALVAGRLSHMGYKSESWLSWQIPILTEGKHAYSRITNINKKKVTSLIK